MILEQIYININLQTKSNRENGKQAILIVIIYTKNAHGFTLLNEKGKPVHALCKTYKFHILFHSQRQYTPKPPL